MKKFFLTFLSFLLVLSLAGCGETGTGGQGSAGSQEDDPPKQEESSKPKEAAYTIADQVIVDNDACAVTIVSGSTPRSGGAEFKLLLENKTADKTLMYSIDDVAVNGWMVASLFASDVAAGKKSNETLRLSSTDFKEAGLTSADKVEFSLRVYDSNDFLADEFVDGSFTIYPTGLTEAEVKVPARTPAKGETVVVDDDSCTFVILDAYVDKIWGYTLSVYLENKTADKELMYTWNDVSVNGFMLDPFWATSVTAGNKKYSTISFGSKQFEENGITAVEQIDYSLKVYDSDDWLADSFVEQAFTWQPVK